MKRLVILACTFGTTLLVLAFSLCSSVPAFAKSVPGTPKVVSIGHSGLQPDGVPHQFHYKCSSGNVNCSIIITVTATLTRKGRIPNDPPSYETVTDSYETCTGLFGACYDYTLAKLTTEFELVDGNVDSLVSRKQSCGSAGWLCKGVAGVFTEWEVRGPGSVLSGYGPQLYNSSDGEGSQTKYAQIIMNGTGIYSFVNTCTGYLC